VRNRWNQVSIQADNVGQLIAVGRTDCHWADFAENLLLTVEIPALTLD